MDGERVAEVGGIDHVDFEEDDVCAAGDGIDAALFAFLVAVLCDVAGLSAVGDEVDGPVVGDGVVDEAAGVAVEDDAVGAQFGGARDAGDQRYQDDPRDEEPGDDQAVRLVDDVGDEGVEQDGGEHGEAGSRGSVTSARDRDGDGEGAGDHHGENAGGVRAGLLVDVGVEGDRDDDAQERVDDHDRPDGAPPLGRHAVVRQVAGGRC